MPGGNPRLPAQEHHHLLLVDLGAIEEHLIERADQLHSPRCGQARAGYDRPAIHCSDAAPERLGVQEGARLRRSLDRITIEPPRRQVQCGFDLARKGFADGLPAQQRSADVVLSGICDAINHPLVTHPSIT